MRRLFTAVWWLLAATVTPLAAQQLPDNVPKTLPPPPPGVSAELDSSRAVRGQRLQVFVITYGPGDEVFERFGHIALAIADSTTGEDIAFNWGMFSFSQPNFLWRFLTGDTRYWVEGVRTFDFNAFYQGQNRSIRRQRLDLTPLQRGALQDLIAWNVREGNQYYRYDYYNDNCSTRVRDAIDWALKGKLEPMLDSATHFTWRGETARIFADNLPLYAGIEIALGQNADKHLTRWQSGFLPERLAADLATLSIDGRKLIAQDTVLFDAATRAPLPTEPPQRRWPALFAGLTLAAGIAAAARVAAMRGVITAFGTVWYAVAGVLGLALLLAGTVTKHEPYMGSNLSLFQVQPLLLGTAALWFARGRGTRIGRAATWLGILSAVIAMVGLVAQHLPMFFHQHNDVVWMFMAPVHLALGFAALPSRHDARRPSARA